MEDISHGITNMVRENNVIFIQMILLYIYFLYTVANRHL